MKMKATVLGALAAASAANAQGAMTASGMSRKSLDNYDFNGVTIAAFALQLECLEAEFYAYASGMPNGIGDELRNGGPKPIFLDGKTPSGDTLTELGTEGTLYGAKGLAAELAQDEIAHVRTLQGVLEGSLDLACPQLDLGPAFVAAAEAAFEVAGVDAPETQFNPFLNDLFFLHGAFIFEDVGVTGYLGAAAPASRFFDSETFTAVAAILGVEAYHAGAVRNSLALAAKLDTPTPAGYPPVQDIVEAISNLRDAVDGASDLDQGIYNSDGTINLVPTNDAGLVFARTVSQVLNIVFLDTTGKAMKGGFFPEGLNGLIFQEGTREQLEASAVRLGTAIAERMCPAVYPNPASYPPDGEAAPENEDDNGGEDKEGDNNEGDEGSKKMKGKKGKKGRKVTRHVRHVSSRKHKTGKKSRSYWSFSWSS